MYVGLGDIGGLKEVRLSRDNDGSLSLWLDIAGMTVNMNLAELNQLMVALDEAREQAELLPADAPPLHGRGGNTVWQAKLMPIVPPPEAKAG